MKDLKDLQLKDSTVLVRADLNVPIDGEIKDDFKILRSLPTIEYLITQGAKIVLCSHLGRPTEGKALSFDIVSKRLGELLGRPVSFVKDCVGRGVKRSVDKLKPGEVLLLENLRLHPGEEANDESFAQQLADLADIYINDAFASSHRNHASISGVPKLLPHGAGMLLKEEITTLSSVIDSPKKPLLIILGGAKLKLKTPCIFRFLNKADHLIIGGLIAPTILAIKKISISGRHFDEELEKEVEKIELTNPKLHMPIDALVGLENLQADYLRQSAVGKIRSEEQMFDIGPESIRMFSNVIAEAKTIVWNGPLGYVEDERFANGSLAIASAILRSSAFSVVGGSDLNAFLAKNNLRDKFGYVSTGGGAMLDFLSGKEFPGLKALENE